MGSLKTLVAFWGTLRERPHAKTTNNIASHSTGILGERTVRRRDKN